MAMTDATTDNIESNLVTTLHRVYSCDSNIVCQPEFAEIAPASRKKLRSARMTALCVRIITLFSSSVVTVRERSDACVTWETGWHLVMSFEDWVTKSVDCSRAVHLLVSFHFLHYGRSYFQHGWNYVQFLLRFISFGYRGSGLRPSCGFALLWALVARSRRPTACIYRGLSVTITRIHTNSIVYENPIRCALYYTVR